jgi:hypothetical protein
MDIGARCALMRAVAAGWTGKIGERPVLCEDTQATAHRPVARLWLRSVCSGLIVTATADMAQNLVLCDPGEGYRWGQARGAPLLPPAFGRGFGEDSVLTTRWTDQ